MSIDTILNKNPDYKECNRGSKKFKIIIVTYSKLVFIPE